MASFELASAATAFFAEFDSAFASFDGDIVAARYVAPYLAVRADGSSEVFLTRESIARYFEKVLDGYHRRGCRSCRHKALEIVPAGSAAVFATVTWELLNQNASIVTTWRESYNLVRSGEGLKACASMDHAIQSPAEGFEG